MQGPAKTLAGSLKIVRRKPVEVKKTSEIEFVRFGVPRVTLQYGVLLFAKQLYLQRIDNRKCDFILHVKDIFHLAVVTLSPEMITVCGINELRRNAKPIVTYTTRDGKDLDIFLQRIGGRNPVNLTKDSEQDDRYAAFSPDGQWIAFRSDREGGGIFIMGATGESVRRLTDSGFNPAWSPDGKEIVFSTERIFLPFGRGTTSQLWVVQVDSGQKRQIAKGDAVQPAWSPDGRWIAYWAIPEGSGQRDLWIIDSRGGTPIQITNDPAMDWNPVWSPAETQTGESPRVVVKSDQVILRA